MDENELLQLNLPLYGVCDSGDYWDATLGAHIEDDLGMTPLTSDPALIFKRLPDGALSGMLGAYVDECLMGGDSAFESLTMRTLTRFQGQPRALDNTDFVGVRITTVSAEAPRFFLDQRAYVHNL